MPLNIAKSDIRVLLLCGMSDFKLRQKLAGIQDIDHISHILLVRGKKFKGRKVTSFSAPGLVARSRVLTDLYRAPVAFWQCVIRKPDVIIAFYLNYHGLMGWILGKLFNIPVVLVLLGTDLERAINSRRMISILRSAARIAVSGATSKERLIAAGVEESKILHPTSAFSVSDLPIARYAGIEYDLIFVGSLVQVKRVDRLLKAVENLKHRNSLLRLAIVGDGPLRQSLGNLVNELGLDDNVTFVGRVPGNEVPHYLCKSKVFVLTSNSEGLPMAMIEALSCGIPVVVPDAGDINCVVHHKQNGLLVNVSNERELAEALGQVLDNHKLLESLRRGAVATRNLFKSNYSQQAIRRVWETALEGIISLK